MDTLLRTREAPTTDGVDRGRLVELREAAGLSGREMARRLGIQPARYSHYETGKRRFPIMIIRAASAVLGCTLDDLIRPAFSLPARDSAPESFPAH